MDDEKPKRKQGGPRIKTRDDDRRGKAEKESGPFPQGQKPFVPTEEQRKQVFEMVATGLIVDQIIRLIKNEDGTNISKATLYRHFKDVLDDGHLHALSNIGGAMYRGAMDGNAAMMRQWWNIHAKKYGLAETNSLELANADGNPFMVVISKDDAEL